MSTSWLNATVWEGWPVLGPLAHDDPLALASRYTVMRKADMPERMTAYWTASPTQGRR